MNDLQVQSKRKFPRDWQFIGSRSIGTYTDCNPYIYDWVQYNLSDGRPGDLDGLDLYCGSPWRLAVSR
jgi:hypothetical protein